MNFKYLTVFILSSVLNLVLADYPNKPIKVIVPFAPGGTTDVVARIVTQRMSQELGQTMVIENKAGAAGLIGATEASRAKPDGYTLSIATVSTLATVPACYPKSLTYDALKDFLPISNFAYTPNVLAANPKFPASNFEELMQKLNENSEKYSYSSSGPCAILNVLGESFKLATNTKMVHIPFKGSGPSIAGAVSGQVDLIFDNLPSSMPQIQAGKLRGFAVAWRERVKGLENIPTFAEIGLESVNRPVWYGLLAVKETPKEVIDKLYEAVVVALKDPKVIKILNEQGAFPSGNTPEEFAKEIKEEFDWASEIVKKANMTQE